MNKWLIVGLIIIVVFTFYTLGYFGVGESFCDKVPYTETEAKDIARSRLEVFCNEKEIDCRLFRQISEDMSRSDLWTFDFSSRDESKSPYYFFRVVIDSCGVVEKNWQLYRPS